MSYQDRYRAENARINAQARRTGSSVMQPIDPDDPPIPCGARGCYRDAVQIIRVDIGMPTERGFTGCEDPLAAMVAAFAAEPTRPSGPSRRDRRRR